MRHVLTVERMHEYPPREQSQEQHLRPLQLHWPLIIAFARLQITSFSSWYLFCKSTACGSKPIKYLVYPDNSPKALFEKTKQYGRLASLPSLRSPSSWLHSSPLLDLPFHFHASSCQPALSEIWRRTVLLESWAEERLQPSTVYLNKSKELSIYETKQTILKLSEQPQLWSNRHHENQIPTFTKDSTFSFAHQKKNISKTHGFFQSLVFNSKKLFAEEKQPFGFFKGGSPKTENEKKLRKSPPNLRSPALSVTPPHPQPCPILWCVWYSALQWWRGPD